MELNEYVEAVLVVLKKNEMLEQLMSNLAEDSALMPAKNTISDIEKRVMKDRIIELTEEYLGKRARITEKKEKEKKKRFSFVRGIGATPSTTKVTRVTREEKKRIRGEERRIRKKQQLEAELARLSKNE